MSVKISARLSDELHEFVMKQEGDKFIDKLEFVIREMKNSKESSDSDSEVSDNCLKDLSYKRNIFDLEYELSEKVSIFDDNYTYTMLGDFLFEVAFIERFRSAVFKEFKHDSFTALHDRLKSVYLQGHMNIYSYFQKNVNTIMTMKA